MCLYVHAGKRLLLLLLTLTENNCMLSTTWQPSGSVAWWVHGDIWKPLRCWLYSWLHQVFNGFLVCLLWVFLSDHCGSSLREQCRFLTDLFFMIRKKPHNSCVCSGLSLTVSVMSLTVSVSDLHPVVSVHFQSQWSAADSRLFHLVSLPQKRPF